VANYRRSKIAGGTFFFTVVTYERRPLFADDVAVHTLRRVLSVTREKWPFTIDAAVILPDHLHMIWTLPPGDSNFSTRWAVIKARFTLASQNATTKQRTPRQMRQRMNRIWQPRFMEHTIRDELDYERHVDHIHYNPVKHGLVDRPVKWPHSSIHHFIDRGMLDTQWGSNKSPIRPDWM